MAAYLIADLVITDLEGFRAYQQRVGATLARYAHGMRNECVASS